MEYFQPMGPVARHASRLTIVVNQVVAWAQTRQTNGFLETINGLFQAAKRSSRGFKRLSTHQDQDPVIFLIAGKPDLYDLGC